MESDEFNEGYDDYGLGFDLDENPYNLTGSTWMEAEDWVAGWLQAQEDDCY